MYRAVPKGEAEGLIRRLPCSQHRHVENIITACPARDHNKLTLVSKYSTKATLSYLAQTLQLSKTLRGSERIVLERLVPSDLISARLKAIPGFDFFISALLFLCN